jgi:adenosylhomocysteine nucleosidase
MTIVVLVSADAEWAAVKEYSSPECVEPTPYGECFTRAVGNEEVLFFHGGWGKIAAAAATEYAINRWRPDVLINIGTCGGIEGRVERGEKLLVTRAITYDVQEAIGDSLEAIRSYTTDIEVTWLDDSLPLEARRVSMVSGDRDLVPSQVSELIDRFDAVAADWESGAIAWVAHRRRVRLLIVRAVSDLVNTQAGEAIGSVAVFEAAARRLMRVLLGDLGTLVPYVLARCRVRDGIQ